MKTKSRLLLAAAFWMTGLAQAQAQTQVQMNAVDEKGIGKALGTVVISQTQYGLVFTPSLKGLPPGLHGFHVHENASCEPKEQDGRMVAGLSAGSHFDPAGSKHHSLPWGDGHLGDLPALAVDAAGNANNPVLSPRLKMADVEGRSLLIHIGGDNYADQPEPSGGGGTRIACGVIK